MLAERIHLESVAKARQAIEALGSSNTEIMATRAIHINVMLRGVPGDVARIIKGLYNDVGAEAAISNSAYRGEEGVTTDMIVMGTLYHHREVKRVVGTLQPPAEWLGAIEDILKAAPETAGFVAG
ncbi:MAG: hypothetical protein AB1733_11520 [Thermodesulfobacteriota bacterium]